MTWACKQKQNLTKIMIKPEWKVTENKAEEDKKIELKMDMDLIELKIEDMLTRI